MSLLFSQIALYVYCARLPHFHSKAQAILLFRRADGHKTEMNRAKAVTLRRTQYSEVSSPVSGNRASLHVCKPHFEIGLIRIAIVSRSVRYLWYSFPRTMPSFAQCRCENRIVNRPYVIMLLVLLVRSTVWHLRRNLPFHLST